MGAPDYNAPSDSTEAAKAAAEVETPTTTEETAAAETTEQTGGEVKADEPQPLA